jgi:hypothetical protein
MCRIAERVESLKLRALQRFDESGQWAADGFVSAASWLRAHTSDSQPLTVANRLAQLPVTSSAFETGAISRRHATVIADAATPARLAALLEVEAQLVEIAKRVPPSELRAVVRRLTDAIDGDGGAAADETLRSQRRMHLALTLGGIGILERICEPIGHEVIATALAKEMDRDFQRSDSRTRPQRRYDALVNICRRDLERGGRGTRRTRPHISVVVDLAELERRSPAVAMAVRNEAEHVGRLSGATLELLSCDCSISRVITSGPSEILDVGRATRTISSQLWKALVVRDGHCTAPGCERPPGDCDGHHLWHWAKGGPTDLANLQMLCWEHHRAAHRGARGP